MNINNKKELGKLGEDISAKYLENKGYSIIERNFYCKQGEIDIIAKQNQIIIFVEVKTRKNNNFGTPSEAINNLKKIHILKSAQYFLYKNKLSNKEIRFDAIEVKLESGKFKINHIKNII